ncbi:MAG TPA: molybdopterin-dependent oxidoreductase, partial [Planctomycetota bacterium]|nr:molybdopterin-dependent oxidoreductase [Planctomycetota bacterium]
MPITPTTCPLDCPDACGALVQSDEAGRFVGLRGNPAHGYSRGHLCSKTAAYGDLIQSNARLLSPLVRDASGVLVSVTWERAIATIAERMRGIEGPEILAAWYAGSMGRIARKFPLRMMHALGATLVDDGLCDNTASAGYECVLGRVVGFDLERTDECDFVLLWGCDMARTVQHLQPAVQQLCKRGVPVVAIDIYETDTLRALRRWGGHGLVVRPGTDAALALALARLAFERGGADRAFLAREAHGAADFEAHVRAGHDLAWAEHVTGAPRAEIELLFERLTRSAKPLVKTGVGWTRRRNGGMSMRAVCSLMAVLGRVDRLHYESFDTFRLAEDVVERADLRPARFPDVRVPHVQLGLELESGRYRALFVWGHNPAVMCPDSARVRRALEREDLFVVVHEQFLTESAERADVVLPATMFAEHADVYRSYGHRRMQLAHRACLPPPGPRSNVETFAAIARALGLPPVTHEGTCESLSLELLEASRARIGEENFARLLAGEPVALVPPVIAGKRWDTPSGLIELASDAAAALGEPQLATYVPDDACGGKGEFWLTCAPSKFGLNSTFSHSPRHMSRAGRPRVYVHPSDAERVGVVEGGAAVLSNERGSVTLDAELTRDMVPGMLRVDGVPRASDVPEGVGINALVAPDLSDLG